MALWGRQGSSGSRLLGPAPLHGRAENGAAYLMIVSPTTDRLTAASPPVAKKVEHNRRNK